jgi:hypothetical protein
VGVSLHCKLNECDYLFVALSSDLAILTYRCRDHGTLIDVFGVLFHDVCLTCCVENFRGHPLKASGRLKTCSISADIRVVSTVVPVMRFSTINRIEIGKRRTRNSIRTANICPVRRRDITREQAEQLEQAGPPVADVSPRSPLLSSLTNSTKRRRKKRREPKLSDPTIVMNNAVGLINELQQRSTTFDCGT